MAARTEARILEGDFETEGTVSWMRFEDGRFRFLDPDAPRKPWWTKPEWIEYGIDDVATVDDLAMVEATGVGRSLGLGVLGGIALGVWGAVLGAVVGGIRFDHEIEIVFRDGKRVEVQVSDEGWDEISYAYRESLREARRTARREAHRQAIEGTPPSTPSRPSPSPGLQLRCPGKHRMHGNPVAAMDFEDPSRHQDAPNPRVRKRRLEH